MQTLADLVDSYDDDIFVGRARELAVFEAWLRNPAPLPAVLDISGHGGVGKSTLLRAFARQLRRRQLPIVLVDCRDLTEAPSSLAQAIGVPPAGDLTDYLQGARPLIMLDTFEELGELLGYVQQDFLSQLPAGVKVVVAGRHTLVQAWPPE